MNNNLKSIFNCELCDNKPCLIGCPLDNDIPEFIKQIRDGNFKEAYNVLAKTTVLMPICGRICPHFKQCEGSCVKKKTRNKVRIGKLEATIGDMALVNNWKFTTQEKTEYKVAVIGSGPAGLTCAAFLRKSGIGVTIYEKHDYLGGLLIHGIPEFRLPKEIVEKVVNNIVDVGIDVKYNMELGKNITLSSLKEEYDAIFLGLGANISNKMHIEGEKLNGVYGGNEYLEKNINLDLKNKIVVVTGGGDVAIDVSRTLIRKGAKKVLIIYRRSEKEMRAEIKEIAAAKKDGIELLCNTNIVKIIGEEKVEKIRVVKTESRKDSNETEIIDIIGTEEEIECDYIFRAIGSHPSKLVKKLGLDLNEKGKILIDKFGHTSDEKIFSGGDIAGTKSTVAWAARAGRNAAYSIIEFLK